MQNIKARLAAECQTANEMIGYKARLESFSCWELSTPSPEEMAAAGFYMTGKEDETRSPFNMKIIAGWEEGDSPKKEALKRKKENSLLSRKWAPKDCLGKTVSKMTLNEKYRLESLTFEAQMEYRINQWTEEIPKFIASINGKVHSIYNDQDDIDQKLTRVKMLETKQRENLNQMKITLKEMKASNQKIFSGAIPNCDENNWANGRWDMIWEDHLKECNQSQHLPKPNQNSMRSRQSIMVSASVNQNAPPSAKKADNWARKDDFKSFPTIDE
jgi:hypothetical protein